MNKFKKLYRDFFGLNEQSTTGTVKMSKATADPAQIKKLTDTGVNVQLEGEVDEAKLVNHITDYRGGVEFILRDPNDAGRVANEIRDWTERKGFVIINKKISKSGKVGYFYFRLGEDPGSESQKIQGYISQMPEIAKFRFNVRGEKKRAPQPAPEVAPAPQRPMRKI